VRLFVAVDVPLRLKGSIEEHVVGTLRDRIEGARWTRSEGRHLTLKFLGNVDDERVTEVADAVRAASVGHRRFRASFSEMGGFPNLRRPRVLWIGLGEGAEAMAELATDIDRELAVLGFESESRPFHGHLTLARFPRPSVIDLPDVVAPAEGFDVEDVVLFRSQLHPKGARYTALEHFPLRESRGVRGAQRPKGA
jgi:2'-5' RNA ligase